MWSLEGEFDSHSTHTILRKAARKVLKKPEWNGKRYLEWKAFHFKNLALSLRRRRLTIPKITKPHHTVVCTNRKTLQKIVRRCQNTHISAVWRWAELRLLMLFEPCFFLLFSTTRTRRVLFCVFRNFIFLLSTHSFFFCFFALILICIHIFFVSFYDVFTHIGVREKKNNFFTFCFVLCDFSHSIFVEWSPSDFGGGSRELMQAFD